MLLQAAKAHAPIPQLPAIAGRAPRAAQQVGGAGPAIEPELATLFRETWGDRQPEDRIRTLLGRTQPPSHNLTEPRQGGLYTGGINPARMHGIHRHTGPGQLLSPHFSQNHKGTLGLSIGERAIVRFSLELQIGHIQLLGVHTS